MLTIEKIRELITPLCEKYRVRQAYLFGSYARREATSESDIDIRIDRTGSALTGLLAVSHFHRELEEAFRRPVDLLTALPQGEYSKIFRDSVKADEVLLYEL